ncbi:lipoprotein [Shouchella miscanthi]|uniref:Lipoprotein n=1 Tax=Shouchella miscanthi TaxID=2598861 RepID=A0ABU6NIT6_9BACI|nr:lipoprotein [Shouchella miscanthi]
MKKIGSVLILTIALGLTGCNTDEDEMETDDLNGDTEVITEEELNQDEEEFEIVDEETDEDEVTEKDNE